MSWCFQIILALLALFSAAYFYPNDPFGFSFELNSYKLDLPESFSGGLLANRILQRSDHLYVNEIRGPESFAIWKGRVFTGLADGRIVEVLNDRLETIAVLDPNGEGVQRCATPWIAASGNCSRPLGLRFDSSGRLYSVDPYHGVYRIDIASGHYQLILDINKHRLPDGSVAGFLDDFLLFEQSDRLTLYLTLASTRWPLHDVYFTAAEHDRTGQLLSFDTKTEKLRVEAQDLAFPNGLEWIDDKSAFLVNEFNTRSILKFHLKGTNKGKLTKWATNLPGEPDNIKRSADRKRETYWVGLMVGRNRHNQMLMDKVTELPALRRAALRVQRLVGTVLEIIGFMSQCNYLVDLGFDIQVGTGVSHHAGRHYGLAVEIDADGQIVNSMHDPTGQTSALSEVHEVTQTDTERHFLLGSFLNHYLGRLVVGKHELQDQVYVTARKSTVKEAQTTTTTTTTKPPRRTTARPNIDKHTEL